MYTKERIVLGIMAVILSGTVIFTSLVFGIIHIAHGRYDDIHSFNVKLTGQKEVTACGNFLAKKNEQLSFWLKVPDRRIENRDFQLIISISDFNKAIDTTWKNNFRFGSWRNGSDQGQYYHLGTYDFRKDFNGTICYNTSGKWIAPYNGALVIRRAKPLKLPWRDMGFFSSGLALLILGLNVLLKNKKCID